MRSPQACETEASAELQAGITSVHKTSLFSELFIATAAAAVGGFTSAPAMVDGGSSPASAQRNAQIHRQNFSLGQEGPWHPPPSLLTQLLSLWSVLGGLMRVGTHPQAVEWGRQCRHVEE